MIFSIIYNSFKVFMSSKPSEFSFTLYYSTSGLSIIVFSCFLLMIGLEYSLAFLKFFGKKVPYDFTFLMIGWLVFLINNLFYGSEHGPWTASLIFASFIFGAFLVLNSTVYLGIVIGFVAYVLISVICLRRRLVEVLRIEVRDSFEETPVGLNQRELELLVVERYQAREKLQEIKRDFEEKHEISNIEFDFEMGNDHEREIEMGERPLLQERGREEEKEEEEMQDEEDEVGRSGVDICSICQRDFENNELVTYLPACLHCYHATCLKPWLLRNRNCPMCRREAIHQS